MPNKEICIMINYLDKRNNIRIKLHGDINVVNNN